MSTKETQPAIPLPPRRARVVLLFSLLLVVCLWAYLHFTGNATLAPAPPAPPLPPRGTTPEPMAFMDTVAGRSMRILAHQPYARDPDVDPYDQTLDLYLPEPAGDLPLLIFIHGGGWTSGDKYLPEQGRYFASQNIAVASINYRLATLTPPPNAATDIAAAIAYLREAATDLGINPEHIILMGHSAGAHLAALVVCDGQYLDPASAAAIRGVILLDGSAYHVPEMMRSWRGPLYIDAFGLNPNLWHAVSPYHYARGRTQLPPFLLVVADEDRIRTRAARELTSALQRGGGQSTILRAPDEDHISLLENLTTPGNPLLPHLLEFIRRPPAH